MDDSRPEVGAVALPADFVRLRLILQGSDTALDLDRADMVLGRHSEADVRLPLPDVSRRHCRLFFLEGAWHVQDLKSLNGTLLNGEKIEEALICHGDCLRVGGFSFSIDLHSSQTAQKPEMILPIDRTLALSKEDAHRSRQAS